MLTRTEINMIAEKTAELISNRIDTVMDSKQCADYLGITVNALRKRCNDGKLPFHKRHGSLYFSRNEINDYLKND
jgi:hypothetical protein|nr:MAG TPA: helix-turn-helix domain protein [Caudoviricetes sp.]